MQQQLQTINTQLPDVPTLKLELAKQAVQVEQNRQGTRMTDPARSSACAMQQPRPPSSCALRWPRTEGGHHGRQPLTVP